MPNSIFINENFFNMSDPQPGWLFHVFFYKTTGTSKIDDDHLIAETATLPKFETVTVTKKYFGSEKEAEDFAKLMYDVYKEDNEIIKSFPDEGSFTSRSSLTASS